jgi:hypothetical protein
MYNPTRQKDTTMANQHTKAAAAKTKDPMKTGVGQGQMEQGAAGQGHKPGMQHGDDHKPGTDKSSGH